MNTIAELLETKGREVRSIEPDAQVYRAIEAMAAHGIGSLLVMEGDALVGIMTERDYARKVILQGKSSRDTPVKAIMTTKVICCAPSSSIDECMAVMTERKVRHLPVLHENRVVGVVSIGDLVKTIIAQQKHVIEELERYVSG
jgi:CBS domain-containing protein